MASYSLRQLEYLVTCIDVGTFAGAADKLNVSQPSISTAIAKLEGDLGVQLLLRHHAQGVTPTANGERLLQSARNLLSHAADLQRQAEMAGKGVAGELRLGSFVTLAPVLLPGMIANLKSSYPEIRLQLGEGTQDELIDDLRNGRHEMALLYDLDLPGDLKFTRLREVAPHALLPEKHPLASQKTVSLTDLAREPFVLLDVKPSREYFLSLFSGVGVEPRISFSSPSLELVRGLVGQGLGFSLLATRPHGDITYDGQALAIRPIEENVANSRIGLATLKALRPTRIMELFEAFSIGWLGDEGSG